MTEHSARLLARLGERASVLAADPQLDPLLEGLFDRAEGRLPHRPIRRDAMVDRVADALLVSDDTPDSNALTRLNASDLYLALAIVGKDMRALEIAEAELMPAVRQAVCRVDSSSAFVEEVSQRIRERLFVGDGTMPPAIMQYRGAGSLARWVRIIASRLALEIKGADADREDEREDALSGVASPSDPELEALWRACADDHGAALAEALAGLPKRDRNLLRQRYLDDLDLDALGRLYRVNPSMTDCWLKQIKAQLTSAICTTLAAKLSITEEQALGMERLVASQLQLDLPRLLRSSVDEPGGERGR